MNQAEPSSTALTVLQGLLYTAQNPAYAALVPKEASEIGFRILSSCPAGQRRLRQLDSRWFKALAPAAERLILPGITLHYALRKKFIEDYTLEQIHRGTTQVVNLGAGFDSLTYRLATRFQNANFIELDHPATSAIKIDLMRENYKIPDNLYLGQADFTKQSLNVALDNIPIFNSTRQTLYILEGILMYLDEKSVVDTFMALSRATSGNFDVIFTYTILPNGSKYSHGVLLRLYLKFKNEPLNWMSDEGKLKNLLEGINYKLKFAVGPDEFREEYLNSNKSIVLHEGEGIAVAQYHGQS